MYLKIAGKYLIIARMNLKIAAGWEANVRSLACFFVCFLYVWGGGGDAK